MRELKFRAWHKELGHFLSEDKLHDPTHCPVIPLGMYFKIPQDICVHQQSIGIHDKNGKEIYEGDIIQAEEDGEPIEPVEVVWRGGGWCIHAHANNLFLRVTDWGEYKVIGNIFENPELLK